MKTIRMMAWVVVGVVGLLLASGCGDDAQETNNMQQHRLNVTGKDKVLIEAAQFTLSCSDKPVTVNGKLVTVGTGGQLFWDGKPVFVDDKPVVVEKKR